MGFIILNYGVPSIPTYKHHHYCCCLGSLSLVSISGLAAFWDETCPVLDETFVLYDHFVTFSLLFSISSPFFSLDFLVVYSGIC